MRIKTIHNCIKCGYKNITDEDNKIKCQNCKNEMNQETFNGKLLDEKILETLVTISNTLMKISQKK